MDPYINQWTKDIASLWTDSSKVTMASVVVASLSTACTPHRSLSPSSTSSSLLCQASLQPLCSKATINTLRKFTTLPSLFSDNHHGHWSPIVVHAVAEAMTEELSFELEEGGPNELSKLKLESDLLKKKAKRAELRRKRLVRKRHLRKKGRWPPSKMAKLKNV